MVKLKKHSDLDKCVAEYKEMEKDVIENFISGIIKLGNILLSHRQQWKPQGQWMEYLEKAGISTSGANQMIRIYEYSQNYLKTLYKANITNWDKINLFLTLDDGTKEKVADEIGGNTNSTTNDLREAITKVRGSEETLQIYDKLPTDEKGLLDLMKGSTLIDISFTAKELVKNISRSGKNMTSKCVPVAEAFLHVQKSINILNNKHGELTLSEKRFWNALLRSQLDKIKTILK